MSIFRLILKIILKHKEACHKSTVSLWAKITDFLKVKCSVKNIMVTTILRTL